MKVALCDDNNVYLNYIFNIVKPLLTNAKLSLLIPNELELQVMNKTFPYDIIITDIDMGHLNGINLAKEINKINPSCIIIFISSYINFATDVYDVDHIYFILKSEAEKRLPKALEKALSVINERKSKLLQISYQKTDYLIPISDITYIEALGRYLFIHTVDQTYKYIHSLKEIASDLSPEQFVRCHNSYMINLSFIHSINRTKCELSNGIDIPISGTYKEALHQAYIKYVSNKFS